MEVRNSIRKQIDLVKKLTSAGFGLLRKQFVGLQFKPLMTCPCRVGDGKPFKGGCNLRNQS
jgi:hypothetical protein